MEFTILGLFGPSGSGKDLVADWLVDKKGFVKLAFADPMKRFAQRTFGFDVETLWGPAEKRNAEIEVTEEWWGRALMGFQTAAEEIVNEVLLVGDKVTGYLKLLEWFTGLHKTYTEKISARVILQTLGTEWGRAVDPLMWLRYAHTLAVYVGQGHPYTQFGGLSDNFLPRAPQGVVIPDHRFKNEIEKTQERGGYIIRVRRMDQESTLQSVGVANHVSEAEHKTIADEDCDLVIQLHEFKLPEQLEALHQKLERTVYLEETWKHKKMDPEIKGMVVTLWPPSRPLS